MALALLDWESPEVLGCSRRSPSPGSPWRGRRYLDFPLILALKSSHSNLNQATLIELQFKTLQLDRISPVPLQTQQTPTKKLLELLTGATPTFLTVLVPKASVLGVQLNPRVSETTQAKASVLGTGIVLRLHRQCEPRGNPC